jgi:hypothetical protein
MLLYNKYNCSLAKMEILREEVGKLVSEGVSQVDNEGRQVHADKEDDEQNKNLEIRSGKQQ